MTSSNLRGNTLRENQGIKRRLNLNLFHNCRVSTKHNQDNFGLKGLHARVFVVADELVGVSNGDGKFVEWWFPWRLNRYSVDVYVNVFAKRVNHFVLWWCMSIAII